MPTAVTDFSQFDTNGQPVNLNDIIDDQLVTFVESFNRNLGEVGDEHWKEFQKFQQMIKEREYQILNPSEIASNEYQTYDVYDEESLSDKFIWGIANFIAALSGSKVTLNDRFNDKKLVTSSTGQTYIKGKTYKIEDRFK